MSQWRENLTLFLLFAQVVATVFGLGVVYWKIARKVTQWEEVQKQTVNTLNEQKEEARSVRDKLGQLAERVYELFGQLKAK